MRQEFPNNRSKSYRACANYNTNRNVMPLLPHALSTWNSVITCKILNQYFSFIRPWLRTTAPQRITRLCAEVFFSRQLPNRKISEPPCRRVPNRQCYCFCVVTCAFIFQHIDKRNLHVGMLCLAVYAEDESFYRARVLSLDRQNNCVQVITVCTFCIVSLAHVSLISSCTVPYFLE